MCTGTRCKTGVTAKRAASRTMMVRRNTAQITDTTAPAKVRTRNAYGAPRWAVAPPRREPPYAVPPTGHAFSQSEVRYDAREGVQRRGGTGMCVCRKDVKSVRHRHYVIVRRGKMRCSGEVLRADVQIRLCRFGKEKMRAIVCSHRTSNTEGSH